MTREATRRRFLKDTTQTAALTAAVSALGGVHTLAASAQEKVRLGIIGCGGIMTHHVKGLVGRNEAAEITWLCDVDPGQITRMSAVMAGSQPALPKRSLKYEDVLNDRDVDAVDDAVAIDVGGQDVGGTEMFAWESVFFEGLGRVLAGFPPRKPLALARLV